MLSQRKLMENQMIGFMLVQGIEKLYNHIKEHRWTDISQIVNESWGTKSCTVKTIDGSILKFFELLVYTEIIYMQKHLWSI